MSEEIEISIPATRRIVAVSRWRKPNCDSHLRNIYKKRDYGCFNGYFNFFNESLDIMKVAAAEKHLNWIKPNPSKKRPKLRRRRYFRDDKFDNLPGSLNKYTTLCVYPASEFYWHIGNTEIERKSVLREAIRQSMIKLVNATNLPLKWVAAVRADHLDLIGMIVISKKIFNSSTWEFEELDKCFPAAFFRRKKMIENSLNYIEYKIAKAFFEQITKMDIFEKSKKALIEISRQYKFKLPLIYYDYLHLDNENLLEL